ncbi:Sec-independent protein translocase subunit TatA [Undibacterium sp. SXout20W]|uniref:Sec-independent protein translocase subunit TatA n=1 Tax=Undibacterium sp. SXout20W TaxID=3413051 RepID=UPI003BF44B5C
MGSFSGLHWIVVLVVVILIFGTKKLGNIGSDLGKAVKGFKDGIKGEEEKAPVAQANAEKTIDVDAKEKSKL